MQFKKLSVAVAIACAGLAGLAGQALAAPLTPAQITTLNNANDVAHAGADPRIIFVSGASAVQKGFTSIISALIPGTKTYFADKNGNDAQGKANTHSYEAVAGTLAAGNGPWSNTDVILIYRVAGGSVWGVNPVARGEIIESLNVTAGTCSDGGQDGGVGEVNANGSAPNALAFKCSTNTRVPDFGVSDVAPILFKQPFNTEGETPMAQLNDNDLLQFAPREEDAYAYNGAIYSLAFGVPTTNNVNIALNRSVVAGIMSGQVGTWDQVDSSLAADDIVICRRVPGSGTQAVENMYFGNFPCGPFNTPANRDDTSAFNPSTAWTWVDANGKSHSGTGKYTIGANTGGLQVVENSSSGNVTECLDAARNGGTYVTKTRDGSAAEYLVEFTGEHKAIGVLSMDSLSKSLTGGNWQFRSMDGNGTYTGNSMSAPASVGTGTFPTLANLMNGSWDNQGWISINVPIRTRDDANKEPIVRQFITKAKDPAILAAITDLKNVAAAIPGGDYPAGPSVLRVAYPEGNQCAPLNRQY